MVFIIIAILIAYLLGSIPTAYIFGKLVKGVDIRDFGSGNVGATNVFRSIGKIPGLIVFVLDFLKGFLVIVLIPMALKEYFAVDLADKSFLYTIMLGVAVIAGHIWTIFLGFKGGKGVATTAGVMTGLSPEIFISCFIVWVIVVVIWRYVSLASIIAATCLPIFALIFGKRIEFTIFCAVLSFVGVYGHKSNIKRLLQGTEKKIV